MGERADVCPQCTEVLLLISTNGLLIWGHHILKNFTRQSFSLQYSPVDSPVSAAPCWVPAVPLEHSPRRPPTPAASVLEQTLNISEDPNKQSHDGDYYNLPISYFASASRLFSSENNI